MSPWPGGSTLITCAPKSASMVEQNGPARACVRSRTLMSSRGNRIAARFSHANALARRRLPRLEELAHQKVFESPVVAQPRRQRYVAVEPQRFPHEIAFLVLADDLDH